MISIKHVIIPLMNLKKLNLNLSQVLESNLSFTKIKLYIEVT